MTSDRKLYVGLSSVSDQEITAVGLLKLVRRGVVESGEYAYGTRYLALPIAFALNPDHMPLKNVPMRIPERRLRDGGALPLTFRDALPDSWGRRVLEAQYGKNLDDIDVLIMTNEDRVGAMIFSDTLPMQAYTSDVKLVPLEAMALAVQRLEQSLDILPEMRRLLQRGGTLGGARPKAAFIYDDRRWIAKFPAQGDDHDVELLEICMLKLAAMCGIEVPTVKLEKIHRGHALLLLRFDREGHVGHERRIHYLSASALLDVPYESNGGSYVELAQVLRRIAIDPVHDLDQLFRRMVFNLIIDNTDDHVKNHGVLHVEGGRYKLSPAFDVVMQLTNLGYQELAIGPGNNHSKISTVLEVAPYFGINALTAENIIQSMLTTVNEMSVPLIEQYGGGSSLKERVRICLKRQHGILFG